MHEPIELPPELAFLKWMQNRPIDRYQSAFWLKSPFTNSTWTCDFDDTEFEIDFEIILGGGAVLCYSHPHRTTEFKTWLCVQTHPDVTGGVKLSSISAKHKFHNILRLIDFLLINDERFGVIKYGFSSLTADDLKAIFSEIACGDAANSVYQWYSKIASFAKVAINEISESVHSEICSKYPGIFDVNLEPDSRNLDLTDAELVSFRVWLFWKGFMKRSPSSRHRYQADSSKLAALLYSNTLWGKYVNFPQIPELYFEPTERYGRREFPAVATRTPSKKRMDPRRATMLKSAIKSLAHLEKASIPIPSLALDEFAQKEWMSTIDVRASGRFATFPQEVVLNTLRKSIDFSLDFGEDILQSYVNVACEAKNKGISVQTFCSQNGIIHLLTEKVRFMNVSTWWLAFTMTAIEANPYHDPIRRAPTSEFFRRLRGNEGLYDLIVVLYGSIQIVVGVLSARRQAELLDLYAADCLDQKRNYLIFHNRKTGVNGLRERELRPIPAVAVRLIEMLRQFQDRLLRNGLIDNMTNLFAIPNALGHGLTVASAGSFNGAMDKTCDYFNVEKNANGQRYYLRQHLLRRFFPTLFFWGRSFGGMETLRWFLGHTDVEHLYHYITESTPGAALRWTKAEYVAQEMQDEPSHLESLAILLENKFGSRNFTFLDSDELTSYIDLLIDDGLISVEPFFFDTECGKDFKILVKVIREADHD